VPVIPRLVQLAAHLQAADAGQHQIQHHKVRPPLLCQRQGGQPVGRMPGFQACVGQVAGYDLGDGRIVFDDQDAPAYRPAVHAARAGNSHSAHRGIPFRNRQLIRDREHRSQD
jgi:hypothetical protein